MGPRREPYFPNHFVETSACAEVRSVGLGATSGCVEAWLIDPDEIDQARGLLDYSRRGKGCGARLALVFLGVMVWLLMTGVLK